VPGLDKIDSYNLVQAQQHYYLKGVAAQLASDKRNTNKQLQLKPHTGRGPQNDRKSCGSKEEEGKNTKIAYLFPQSRRVPAAIHH
jgi:hypothetical protein